MPQGLNEVKRRIKSVNSTRQITKAMELVSTAKLKKSRERLDRSKPYFETVLTSIQEVLASSKGVKHPFIEKREVKNSLYILITSDKGLAGGYNSNVCKELQNEIKDKSTSKIITIGSKGRDYFTRRGYNVIHSVTGISETPDSQSAFKIGDMAIDMYRNGEVDEIKIVYTLFKNTISYVPEVITLLPASIKGKKPEDMPAMVRFEPSAESVLESLIPKYINSTIYGALIEASASENGSRRLAMENATDNADEMIVSLDLAYNRARQAAITQEITEIVGGAEALK